MPTLLNATASPKKTSKPKLSAEARANILFQAHLTTTEHKAPENFSPKVIRKAALCSPRHFLDERASFRSVVPEPPRKSKSNGKLSSRRQVHEVHVTKKKKSMLATVKTRAPMVEVVTKKVKKDKELNDRTRDYDRKYETARQREKKEFSTWLDRLGTAVDPGSVPMDKRYAASSSSLTVTEVLLQSIVTILCVANHRSCIHTVVMVTLFL